MVLVLRARAPRCGFRLTGSGCIRRDASSRTLWSLARCLFMSELVRVPGVSLSDCALTLSFRVISGCMLSSAGPRYRGRLGGGQVGWFAALGGLRIHLRSPSIRLRALAFCRGLLIQIEA